MTKEQKEAIDRIKYNDIAKPLYCGDITICNIDDLKTILSMLEEQDKIISLMVEKFADIDFDDMCLDCECCVGNGCVKEERELYESCIKQYFKNKVKEV